MLLFSKIYEFYCLYGTEILLSGTARRFPASCAAFLRDGLARRSKGPTTQPPSPRVKGKRVGCHTVTIWGSLLSFPTYSGTGSSIGDRARYRSRYRWHNLVPVPVPDCTSGSPPVLWSLGLRPFLPGVSFPPVALASAVIPYRRAPRLAYGCSAFRPNASREQRYLEYNPKCFNISVNHVMFSFYYTSGVPTSDFWLIVSQSLL